MRTKTAKKNKIPKARAITNDPYVVWLFSLVFFTFSGMEVVETGKDKQQRYNKTCIINRHNFLCIKHTKSFIPHFHLLVFPSSFWREYKISR